MGGSQSVSLFLTSNGDVLSAGHAEFSGRATDTNTPRNRLQSFRLVPGLPPAKSLAFGGDSLFALDRNGHLHSW